MQMAQGPRGYRLSGSPSPDEPDECEQQERTYCDLESFYCTDDHRSDEIEPAESKALGSSCCCRGGVTHVDGES